MGAVGAAWFETLQSAGGDKSAAFTWGGGEKFAGLLVDTCVHRVLFRDEPAAAGNRLVADTLMTLQDLATARVPLSADATTVALSACRAFVDDINDADAPGRAAAVSGGGTPRLRHRDGDGRARRDSARWAHRVHAGEETARGRRRRGIRVVLRQARRGEQSPRRAKIRRTSQRRRLGLRGVRLHELRVQARVLQVRRPRRGVAGAGESRVEAARMRAARARTGTRPSPGIGRPVGGFSNFASRGECKRSAANQAAAAAAAAGTAAAGGTATRARFEAGRTIAATEGSTAGSIEARGTVAGPREGGRPRGNSGGNRRYGGGRGGRGGRDRDGGWDDADAGGWNDRNGDDRFGGY